MRFEVLHEYEDVKMDIERAGFHDGMGEVKQGIGSIMGA